jgi:hypothetical protein
VEGLHIGWVQILTPAFTRLRWTLSKKLTVFILSIIGIGAIAYNYLLQFKDIKFSELYDDEEDSDIYDRN